MIKYILFLILGISKSLIVQTQYIVYLDKEFRYKVERGDLQGTVDSFTVYSKVKGNSPPEPIFLASNIALEYKEGTILLCVNLNRKLKKNFDK